MKFLKLLGKIVLWVIAVYILTLINTFVFIWIAKPKPLISITPILCLAILEVILGYKLFKRKGKGTVWVEEMMEKKRSKGITFLGWYDIVVSAIGFLGSLILLFNPPEVILSRFENLFKYNPEVILKWGAASGLASCAFVFIIGINILRLKETWRRVSIYFCFLSILYNLLYCSFLMRNPIEGLEKQIPTFILLFIIIYFLTRPKVKEQFK